MGTLGTSRITVSALLEPAVQVASVAVTAVAARDKARAEAFALRHAIPAAYGSYDDLLADPAIDAVYNPLPNSLHGPWTLKAIAAGKHVLVEKPFAANAAEAAEIARAAAAAGVVVMEAMHYRYHPMVHRLQELAAELGPVRHIQCWTSWPVPDPGDIRLAYDLGGGALMDGGCYAVDCVRLLAGADREPSVTGALADASPPAGKVADRAMAVRLAWPDGTTGWLESAFTADGEFRADVHVAGEAGTVRMENFIRAHASRVVATRGGAVIADERGDGDTTFTHQLRAFAAAVADPAGGPVLTSPDSAVVTMRIIDAAYRAAGLEPR